MYRKDDRLIFSPSDLMHFMESEFVTWMDRYALEFPDEFTPDEASETDQLLQRKGQEHEQDYLQRLKQEGRQVVDVSRAPDRFDATMQAMKEGSEVIYQGALRDAEFAGYADFLIKVVGDSASGNSASGNSASGDSASGDSASGNSAVGSSVVGDSAFGDFHYEPWDTKLALKAKPYFLIQLACYADLLRVAQGVLPRQVHVILGDKKEAHFRTEDYLYFYRELRDSFLSQQHNFDSNKPPDFMGLEEFGRWSTHAEERMEELDHLCRVANIRTVQIRKLYADGIKTMTQLARSPKSTVKKMQPSTFGRLKEQAQLQLDSKDLDKPEYKVISPQPEGLGLWSLPPASPLDVYFDMEGYPLLAGGLEYLFGATIIELGKPVFVEWWAHTQEEEKAAFEAFVDWCHERWQRDNRMHIYHYASYEKTALKKLMGKYGTREKELDGLLRNEVLVDLFTVVRQGIMVGESSYSLKSVEHLYREKRAGDVATAVDSVVAYQKWLDHKDGDGWQTSKILAEIRAYNKEDCDSTWQLADWLRALQKKRGFVWTPTEMKTEPESKGADQRTLAAQLAQKMLASIPVDEAEKTEEMKLRELLAYVLEFHWREAKPVFWAKYDRAEMTEQELFEDPGCLAGLKRLPGQPGDGARSWFYDYKFDPDQDTKIDSGDKCFFAHDLKEMITVESIDVDAGRISLKRAKNREGPPAHLSLIKDEFVGAEAIASSIYRTAVAYMETGELPAALRDFLCRHKPRVCDWIGGPIIDPTTDMSKGTADVVARLDDSTLCIQGPPGSGKTYTAAEAVVELIKHGKRVGISSNSHKAIVRLMEEVDAHALTSKVDLRAVKVGGDAQIASKRIKKIETRDLFATGSGKFNVIGGTAWLFSNVNAVGMVDYLFVDEAGQVSIANLVGMAPSTGNLVLIGDQMQLAQPMQGTHPGESGKSLLDFLLKDQQVIADDFGIFLGTSWRMHPDVCSFISGAVYEDRLHSHPSTAKRVLQIPQSLEGSYLRPSGIVYVPVDHYGNSQDSSEEVESIASLIDQLKQCRLVDGDKPRSVDLNDILIVAPYNMQVRRLRNAVPGARVGSVDKFQGQEAAIVIVSMCASSADASPRGLDFIFSKNRLNVAISRAQTLAIVVGSPALARTHCRSVEQIELVNLFCRIVTAGSTDKPAVLATRGE